MSAKVTCLKDDAATLAAAYASYRVAEARRDWASALEWFDIVLRAQERVGVPLVLPTTRLSLARLVENYEWSEWGCDLPAQSVAQH